MPLVSPLSIAKGLPTRLVLLSLALAPGAALAGEYEYVEPAAGNGCASLGAGFVPVQGSRACVRIGGHVRVEATDDMPVRTIAGPTPARSDGPMRAHLRLDPVER